MTVRADGRVEFMNPTAEQLLGIPNAVATARRVKDLPFPPLLRERLLRVTGARPGDVLDHPFEVAVARPDAGELRTECTITRADSEGSLFTAVLTRIGGAAARGDRETDAKAMQSVSRLAVVGSYEWDMQTGQATVSGSFYELHGLEVGDPRVATLADYFQLVHPHDRPALERVAQRARAGKDPAFIVEWRVVRPDGGVRWVLSTAEPAMEAGGDGARHLVGTLMDVTEMRKAEYGLELHRAVTAAIHDWPDAENGAELLLCRLATAFDCAAATLWVPSGDPAGLTCHAFWAISEVESSETLGQQMEAMRFGLGEGLPGRVWEARRPLQLSQVRRTDPNVRAARTDELGFVEAFAFPVLVGDELLAVIELHSESGGELTAALGETLTALGVQLAEFLSSHRSELETSPVSEREREVLQLAATGASIAAMAERLNLSPNTVKTHIEHLYDKLGVTSRSGAVAHGLRTGLID